MENSIEQKKLRAARLMKLRKMTHLSRKDFAEKHKMSPGTLQNWETARFGGLTEKGAQKMMQNISQEGIFCSFEWLMYGIGNSPVISQHNSSSVKDENKESRNPLDTIKREIELFRKNNPNSIIYKVKDDSMEPYHAEGQILAGSKRMGKELIETVNKICIIELDQETTLLRYVKKGTQANTFNLISLNKDTESKHSFLNNVYILSAAPITWIRNKE